MRKCPRCGYELPKGKKVVTRIWVSHELEKRWNEFCKKYETKEIAFNELFRKAEAYDKLKLERSRIAVEPPGKP